MNDDTWITEALEEAYEHQCNHLYDECPEDMDDNINSLYEPATDSVANTIWEV